MKTFLSVLMILIIAVSAPHAADVREYASLAEAIKALGTTETDLQVTDRQPVATAVIVPANIRLVIPRGGLLIKAEGGSLTFATGSSLDAGLYQVFSGFDSGVTFNAGTVPAVYPEWWGAHPVLYGKPPPDSYAAFKAAHDSFGPADDGRSWRGGRIDLSNGDYYLSQTWDITKPLTIAGRQSANHMQSSITRLMFPANTTGIRVQTQYTSIRDLAVHCLQKDKTGHGIDASATVYLERVNVQYFAENGINIVADAAAGQGNANLWSITDCAALNNGGHGLYVSGPDANAGICSKFNGTWNDGWQLYDNSLLGNTYIECHTASASRKSFKMGRGANVLVGCYAEMGQNTDLAPGTLLLGGVMGSQDNYPAVYFEGDGKGAEGTVVSTGADGALTGILLTNYGTGYTKATVGIYPPSGAGAVLTPVIIDGRITSVRIDNGGTGYVAHARIASIVPNGRDGGFRTNRILVANRAPGSTRAVDVILADRANTLLSIKATGTASPFDLLAWNEDTGSYQSEYQGAPASAGIRFTSDATTTETGGRNTPLPPGSVSFPNGLWLGGGANGRQQSIGAAAPVAGEHARGDIVWNLAPAPGGHVGWVCTAAGAPGTWKPFGDIEP